MNVRPAQPEDLREIVRIYGEAVLHTVATFDLEPATETERRQWLEGFTDDDPLLVYDDGDAVLGFAFYLPYRVKPAYAKTKEVTVYIAEEHRRRGAARALYAALIAHARERAVHSLVAVIAGDNPASVALHEELDFERVGTLRQAGYKFDRWVDTTFYQCILAP